MNPNAAIADALRITVREASEQLRRELPPERIRTRAAVTFRMDGTKAVLGLEFPRRYPSHDTETARLMEAAWRKIRPAVLARLTELINEAIQQTLR